MRRRETRQRVTLRKANSTGSKVRCCPTVIHRKSFSIFTRMSELENFMIINQIVSVLSWKISFKPCQMFCKNDDSIKPPHQIMSFVNQSVTQLVAFWNIVHNRTPDFSHIWLTSSSDSCMACWPFWLKHPPLPHHQRRLLSASARRRCAYIQEWLGKNFDGFQKHIWKSTGEEFYYFHINILPLAFSPQFSMWLYVKRSECKMWRDDNKIIWHYLDRTPGWFKSVLSLLFPSTAKP